MVIQEAPEQDMFGCESVLGLHIYVSFSDVLL